MITIKGRCLGESIEIQCNSELHAERVLKLLGSFIDIDNRRTGDAASDTFFERWFNETHSRNGN